MIRIFLNRLPQLFLLPYRGYFWVWHIVAAIVTAIIVFSGFDWWFFKETRSDGFYPLVILAGMGGFFGPILLPIILYGLGKRCKNKNFLLVAVALVQSSVISWIIVAIYKAFTGRIQPALLDTLTGMNNSSGFQFGFYEHGIFWGWPSHHTVVAVAIATVLYLAFRKVAVRFLVLLWAVVVAAGAAVGFHWFSDVIAGAIIGAVVGVVVWRDVNTFR